MTGRDVALELLDLVGEILDDLADGDEDITDARKAYNRKVNKYRRKLWRDQIKPTLEGVMDDDWIDDAADALAIIRLVVRRWA